MKTIFWLLLGLIIYCYAGYPLLMAILAKFFTRPVKRSPIFPSVSIVMAIHNEEDVIETKLQSLFVLDYPTDKIEILIGSDASTDLTDKIIQRHQDHRLHLFIHQQRRGKMATVNDLVAQAKGEIIFFNDARQRIDPLALRNLVANFADPQVGCASGELVFSDDQRPAARGVGLYWKYEKQIRRTESCLHSMLGATGAIYAIRRSLYVPAPANVVLDDMYTPFKAIVAGYRAVFDESAQAFDRPAPTGHEEYRRKARTLYGNYQIFLLFPNLFNPLKSPVAFQLFSHKFLRVMVPFFMILLLPANFFLMQQGNFYRGLFFLQLIFYASAATGALITEAKSGILKYLSKLCYVPYVFCLLNMAALAGFYRFIGGRQSIAWQKARKP